MSSSGSPPCPPPGRPPVSHLSLWRAGVRPQPDLSGDLPDYFPGLGVGGPGPRPEAAPCSRASLDTDYILGRCFRHWWPLK